MKILALLLLSLSVPAAAHHDGEEHQLGSSAEFLRVGVSARAVAMGEAYSAYADEASAIYWNPAGLSRVEKRSATFMHAGYLEDSTLDFGAYAQRLTRSHTLGVSFHYMSAGKIDGTNELSDETGQAFTPHDMALALGYAYEFQEGALLGYAAGGSLKVIRSTLLDTAQTIAGDVGLLSPLYGDRVRVGVTLANLGGGLNYGTETEQLPLLVRLGSALKISKQWAATLDAVKARDEKAYVGAGTEYLLAQSDIWSLAGRMGFNSRSSGDIQGVSGVAAGVGIGFKMLQLDYALVPFGDLGTTHRASLTFKF